MDVKNISQLLKERKAIQKQIDDSENDFYLSISLKVREKRKSMGLTQEDLAEKLNLKRTSITNFEMGKQSISVYDLFIISIELELNLFHEDF